MLRANTRESTEKKMKQVFLISFFTSFLYFRYQKIEKKKLVNNKYIFWE